MIKNVALKVQDADNIAVALCDLASGSEVHLYEVTYMLQEAIPAKHKFALQDFDIGDKIIMYGITVGKVSRPISIGSRITTDNVSHATDGYKHTEYASTWQAPDVKNLQQQHFMGYHRSDGQVGTRNFWLVIPLVFCENRNIKMIEKIMLQQLGYSPDVDDKIHLDRLISLYRSGSDGEAILAADIINTKRHSTQDRVFSNVDGIKFLTHDGGCGGTRQDATILCRLLAAYIMHPNVAGATVLSLGCQNAQVSLLRDTLHDIYPTSDKPLYILEQQDSLSEPTFIADAIKHTFVGLIHANRCQRQPASLSHLTIGLECGGSDGFSGITANPVLGYVSDILVALGGKAILAEFPELNGVEQELINRCISQAAAQKFAHIMQAYSDRALATGAGFDMNPSPGNIKDGLITDAMKSAGAAKKGGTSPIMDVLDYTEAATVAGLHLLCTPGNDVESTTGLAASGANLILFTTGLGTPTGNAICPTVKISSNTALAAKMHDIIDIDAGTIITGDDTIPSKSQELWQFIIAVASGDQLTKAEILGQDDFIPWKRGVSL